MVPRIVITGAPGSGKTACLERLKLHPSLRDFLFFDELARQLLAQNPDFRHQRREFHREIYRRQTARETEASGKAFVSDRGTVDAFAFHPETLADVGTTLEREYLRYTSVIHLGSAARLGERYYQVDEIRRESIDDALAIEQAIGSAWRMHTGYMFLDACEDFQTKLSQCEDLVLRLAGRPATGYTQTG